MEHVIIGTAGHVDHGKTCLIKALTGIETDRLKEEKKRGITIELGFAYLDMPDGSRAGIVDVPGHEKFIKNMLAGAGGMDLVMLVVAADEGVMPQTVEHLDILSILGVKKGVIVLTKTDLVDAELQELAMEDVKQLVKGTFLENAPLVPVSVCKNEGLEELKELLYKMCRELPKRERKEEFRLPIDRVFTLKGFGTIVTGTLAEGKLYKGEDVVLYPENRGVKIRSIQVHDTNEEIAYPGQRVAVNLSDCKKEEILRGDVLASENSLYPTRMVDVRMEVLKHAQREIKNGSRVHIYHGTKELLGKIVLMDRESLKAGESCYAQLRLEEETVVKKGDCCIVRFFSPMETIGGGVVLDVCPKKHKRNDGKVIHAFEIKENGDVEKLLELAMWENRGCFYKLKELCLKYSIDVSRVENVARKLEQEKRIFGLSDEIYIHREEFDFYRKKTEEFLEDFHKKNPLKEGMKEEEARSRLALLKSNYADAVLNLLKKEKRICISKGIVWKADFRVVMKKDENEMMNKILRDYSEAGYVLPTTELYKKEFKDQKKIQTIFRVLINKKSLICLNTQYCIHKDFYEKAEEMFRNLSRKKPVISTGEYRDCLGCSRKVAIALLEYFDKIGYTEKTGEGRILKVKR